MFTKTNILSACALLLLVSESYAGFGLETTRVIYHEKITARVLLPLIPTKAEIIFCSHGLKIKQEMSALILFQHHHSSNYGLKKNTLQITKVASLPADRESLYWLNVKFVAPSEEGQENVLRYSMTNRIKILYRPAALDNSRILKPMRIS